MTECLLCKEQIKEKGSFLRLFLLKKEGPSCCSICYQNFECISEEHCPRCFRNGKSAAPLVIKILNAYLKSIALDVFATGNQTYVWIAKNGRKRAIKSSISHYLPIMKQ